MSEHPELITIKASPRSTTGKNHNRRLRASGLIPGNIIGKSGPTPIELDPKWLSKAWKNGKKFILDFENNSKTVEIKELQINAVKRTALHVDLMYQ